MEFNMPEPVPADVVPPCPLDLSRLHELDTLAAAHAQVTVTQPPEVLLDPEGVPIGVGSPVETTGRLACVVIHAADVATIPNPHGPGVLALPELRAMFPSIRFYDPKENDA